MKKQTIAAKQHAIEEVQQHAIKELKLAGKIALCFLSICFILLIWAFKGLFGGLISAIIFLFIVIIVLVGTRRMRSLFQHSNGNFQVFNSKSNPNLPKKAERKTMQRKDYSREANRRTWECGFATLVVVAPLIFFALFLSGQIKALPDNGKTYGGRIPNPSPKPIHQETTEIEEKPEVATIKNVEREKTEEIDREVTIVIPPKEQVDAPAVTALPSEGVKTPKGPKTGFRTPPSTKTEYSGPAVRSSGIGGSRNIIIGLKAQAAVKAGKVQTTPIQITLLSHDFTNYHKYQDTLNSYRGWLNQNTSLRDEDDVRLLRLTESGISSTTLLFMTGDDKKVALDNCSLRQGWTGVSNFTADERSALNSYIRICKGTFCFNYGEGDSEFSNQVQGELEQIFSKTLVDIPAGHEIYKIAYQILFPIPNLKGIEIDGRLAVIFSEYDVLGQYNFSNEFLTNVLCYALKHR